MAKYIVSAAASQEALERNGAAVESSHDFLPKAQNQARRYTSREYARHAELSEPFGYARVTAGGEVVFEATVGEGSAVSFRDSGKMCGRGW